MQPAAAMRWACCGLLVAAVTAAAEESFPLPFTRALSLESPPVVGKDVYILQHLLRRSPKWASLNVSSVYDRDTAQVVQEFNSGSGIVSGATFSSQTASAVLVAFSHDGYRDDGQPAAALGYKYKVHVPVHANRSIETVAALYDANNTVLHKFMVRAHGHNANAPSVWPDFNNTDPGLNQFSPDGNTPTGLTSFDLNTPEPSARLYGPYPINRAVVGLRGNAAFLQPHIRNGILLHTGEWPGWEPGQPLPNSAGCIHAAPNDIKYIAKTLQALGVVAHKNPFGTLPYPFKPQGLLSVELVR